MIQKTILDTERSDKSDLRSSPAEADGAFKLAISATFTAEPIAETLRFWMNKHSNVCEIALAPYNQVFQQLLDPFSLLTQNTSGVNLVLVRVEDWIQLERADETSLSSHSRRSVAKRALLEKRLRQGGFAGPSEAQLLYVQSKVLLHFPLPSDVCGFSISLYQLTRPITYLQPNA